MPSARPPLSRARVVAEAMVLADEQGLAAVSMRALAGRLGVEAISLNQHVAGAEALLDAMLDAVYGELYLPRVGGEWRAELRARSVSGRVVLLRHRWAVDLLGSSDRVGRQYLRDLNAVLGCLAAQGFPMSVAGTAATLLDAHLRGFVQQEVRQSSLGRAGRAKARSDQVGPQVQGAHPHVAALAENRARLPGTAAGDEFEVALDLVLGAIEDLRAATPTAGAPHTANRAIEVSVPVLGVDGCPGGWVGAVLTPGAPRPRVVVAPTIELLVETVRADVGIAVVGIDIPIGLPDSTIRQADVLARRALPGRAGSVFPTLTRSAYLAADRAAADAVNRSLSGQGVGAQAFSLRAKIVEVDAWLRSRPTVDVVEVHPEVSFATMSGAALPAKRTPEGQRARLDALAAAGIAAPSVLKGSGYAPDDVLDACAVAWSAHRRATGVARWLPDPPEVFSDGIRAAIVV